MSAPLMLRVLSASVAAANRAGNIIRDIMSTGKLGIVDKVSLKHMNLGSFSVWDYIIGYSTVFSTVYVL
jgi:hypothetical protein